MNLKVQISGKSTVLRVKRQTETHIQQTNISRDLGRKIACEVTILSLFLLWYLFEATGSNCFNVLCRILWSSKCISKSIF